MNFCKECQGAKPERVKRLIGNVISRLMAGISLSGYETFRLPVVWLAQLNFVNPTDPYYA
ncbi:hypothetical protein TUM17387_38680 [Shewanella carassii]|nr:hypothetical protein TUM17387_38680 [Shewanella carassii]